MKKAIILCIFIFLAFTNCFGCNKNSNNTATNSTSALTLVGFEEKYKRSEFPTTESDISSVLTEFMSSVMHTTRTDMEAHWTPDEYLSGSEYNCYLRDEIILFNLPSNVRYTDSLLSQHTKSSFSLELTDTSSGISTSFVEPIFNSAINSFGDPYHIEIEGNVTSEHDLRQALAKTSPFDFSCKWIVDDYTFEINVDTYLYPSITFYANHDYTNQEVTDLLSALDLNNN